LKERYNLNKVTDFNDCYCLGHLNYTLNVILRTFKTTLKRPKMKTNFEILFDKTSKKVENYQSDFDDKTFRKI
jgi:hypothetical protein